MKSYYNDDDNSDYRSEIDEKPRRRGLISKHPIIANLIIIVIVALLGLFIAYLSLGLFTKHGQTDKVPKVVNMSYSSAVEKLHDAGFKVEIKDSVYFEDVKPGIVVDQFPAAGAIVKPGRKVYLYINCVHPKEVIIDPGNDTRNPALYNYSLRQAMAQLQELGFKNIKVQYVLGDLDRVIRITSNGRTVSKMQKVPLNASIVIVVYDGRKHEVADSLNNSVQPIVPIQDDNEIETDPSYNDFDEIYFEEDLGNPDLPAEVE